MNRSKVILFPVVIAGLIALFQYMSAEKFVNPVTGRASHVALSEEQESALGLQSYQEVLSESRVVKSGPAVDMVIRIAKRLAPVTGDAGQRFDWQASVIESEQANAFCLPGGKICVYTGILPISQNEAGLATVMGHEIAHAVSRHGSQRMFQGKMAQTLLSGAQFALSMGDMDIGQKRAVLGALGAGAQYGILLPFSRDHESEADEMGLIFMARAGYDPREAISFWERMSENSKGQPPEFASTHPSHGTRIENLKRWMPKALEEYQKAGGR